MKVRKNEKGFTLIEVLAVTIILSLISALLLGILTNMSTSHAKEVQAHQQLYDTTYILKLVTLDIRKSTTLSFEDGQYILYKDETPTEKYIYVFDDTTNTLSRNGIPLSTNINDFNLIGTKTITITIEDLEGNSKMTTLHFRRGS